MRDEFFGWLAGAADALFVLIAALTVLEALVK